MHILAPELTTCRIVEGRDFRLSDRSTFTPAQSGVPALIVNEAFARTYFPTASAVGQEIGGGTDCGRPFAAISIVGVVANSRHDLRSVAAPMVYFPPGGFQGPVTLIVRTAGDPAALIPTIRRAMAELNANTPQAIDSEHHR
jgi:putative ABC transport system permease protein